MKNKLLNVISVCVVMALVVSCASSRSGSCPLTKSVDSNAVTHSFLISDHSRGGLKTDGSKAHIINEDGSIQRVVDTGSSQDANMLPNGNVLSSADGISTEINPDGEVVWQYDPPGDNYLTNTHRLPNGNTVIGINPHNQLHIVDSKGECIKVIDLIPETKDDDFECVRLARITEDGHFLVTHIRHKMIVEYDEDGNTYRRIKTPGGPYAALPLKNGNILISCGATGTVVEIDKNDNIVWQLSKDDLPGNMELGWVAGIERLPNGNTVLVSYYERGKTWEDKTIPQILEVTREKEVVWQYTNLDLVGSASNVQILTTNGKKVKGVIR